MNFNGIFYMNFCGSSCMSDFRYTRIIISADAVVVLSYRPIQINDNKCKFIQRL